MEASIQELPNTSRAATDARSSRSDNGVIEKRDERFSIKFAKVILGTFVASLVGLGLGTLAVSLLNDGDYSKIPSGAILGGFWGFLISCAHVRPFDESESLYDRHDLVPDANA